MARGALDSAGHEADLEIRGEERFGYKVLTVSSAAVPNAIAAVCLAMRDEFGLIPHVYFDWAEGSPLTHFLRFILWGSGEVAPGHPRDPAPGRTRPVPPPARARGLRSDHPELQQCRYWLTLGPLTKHGRIFIGSENFSSTSLNQNRELGLIISSHAVMAAIAGTSGSDFRNGKHWSSA